jgi:hypothetical protein
LVYWGCSNKVPQLNDLNIRNLLSQNLEDRSLKLSSHQSWFLPGNVREGLLFTLRWSSSPCVFTSLSLYACLSL